MVCIVTLIKFRSVTVQIIRDTHTYSAAQDIKLFMQRIHL